MAFPQRQRKGLTLTELLITVSIVVLVAGVMVPLMRPIFEGQETSSAARILSVAFSNARTKAVERQRPYGVWLERSGRTPREMDPIDDPQPELYFKSNRVYFAEQPVPYTGDDQGVKLRLDIDATSTAEPALPDLVTDNNDGLQAGHRDLTDLNFSLLGLPPLQDTETGGFRYVIGYAPEFMLATALQFVRAGDSIQLAGRGEYYPILKHAFRKSITYYPEAGRPEPPTLPSVVFVFKVFFAVGRLDNTNSAIQAQRLEIFQQARRFINRYNFSESGAAVEERGTSFSIQRQPRKTSALPIDMPVGTTIDLSLSGVGEHRIFRLPDSTQIDPDLHLTTSFDSPVVYSPNDWRSSTYYDVVIMFNELGKFDRIFYVNSTTDSTIYGYPRVPDALVTHSRTTFAPTYLMIANEEKVGRDKDKKLNVFQPTNTEKLADNLGEANLLDTSNIWLKIHGSQVTTEQNAAIASGFTTPNHEDFLEPVMQDPFVFQRALQQSRQLIKGSN